jgi:hypothetical protein
VPLLLTLLWLGCAKKPAPIQVEGRGEQVERGPVRDVLEGPASWQGAGMCLAIQEGWAGTGGPAPQLLELTHAGTGTVVRLQAWPWGTPMPQERAGFTLVFAPDLARYRTVPLLSPARTYTLAAPDGSLVQGWIGTFDGRLVVVEHEAPFGRTTAGRDAMEALLGSLRRCGGA